MIQASAVEQTLSVSLSSGYGFTAIVVALLANNNPFGVILASIFFASLSTGGQAMQLVSGVPANLTDVISGIIIFLVATKNIVPMVQKRWRKSQTLAPVKEA